MLLLVIACSHNMNSQMSHFTFTDFRNNTADNIDPKQRHC